MRYFVFHRLPLACGVTLVLLMIVLGPLYAADNGSDPLQQQLDIYMSGADTDEAEPEAEGDAQPPPISTIELFSPAGATPYLLFSFGMGQVSYRDFATSPLYYHGVRLSPGMGWMRTGPVNEFMVLARLHLGVAIAATPPSGYYQAYSDAILLGGDLQAHYLHVLPKSDWERTSLSLGGTFMSTPNLRVNPSLGNAGFGFETMMNFMLSGRVVRDVSRREARQQNWQFFTRTIHPRRREISLQVNAGLLNYNYRPGYAYIQDAELDGTQTSTLDYMLSGHRWSLNGWRLMTSLDYTIYRSTGNGYRWSYIWDAMHAPGRHESFQMASHTINFAVLFNNSK